MRTRSTTIIVGALMLAVAGTATAQMSADVLQPSQQRGGGTECQAGYTSIRANTLDGGMVCVQCPTGYKAPEYNTMIVTHAVNGYAVCVACRKGRPDFNPDTKGYVCRE